MPHPRLQNFVWDRPEEHRQRLGETAALALQACKSASEAENWEEALIQAERLDAAVEELAGLLPERAADFWNDQVLALASLTAALHGLLALDSSSPLPEPRRSDLSWQLTALLDRLLTRPAIRPEWLDIMHTQLLLHGAIDWRERLEQSKPDDLDPAELKRRAGRLFARTAGRLDPLPDWITLACEQLGVTPLADPPLEASRQPAPQRVETSPVSGAPTTTPPAPSSPLWSPEELTEEVRHGLLDGGPRQQLTVAVACVPGASLLCREGQRLELNLAPLLELEPGVSVEPWITAFRNPLQQAVEQGWLSRLELLEHFSSLFGSLSLHWRMGERLEPRQLQRLPELLEAWSRLLGPAHLQAQRRGSSLDNPDGQPLPLQLRHDPIELAALLACGQDELVLEEALARLRREHRSDAFWQAPVDPAALLAANPLECLRLLQRDAGFYAASTDALACLHGWREGAMTCLEAAAIWAPEPGHDVVSLLAIAQELCLESGRLINLQTKPDLLSLLERMAGREVLVVSWSAQAVLDQHRSGRAFRLFHDRVIVPYGLRVLDLPESRHPQRPHAGFRESLQDLIDAVDRENSARPIDLVLVENSAYRLPLLSALQSRAIPGIGPGPELHQLFGLDHPGQPRWREPSRDVPMWRDLPG